MGVMLDTNWRRLDRGRNVVGWPTPAPGVSAYRRIASDAALYRRCGFSAIGFPPATKGAAGAYSGGYDLYDNYDIGSKSQPYATPTAFGTAEDLRRAVAAVHAAGMHAYGDLVMHQYDGGTDNTYTPLGADGRSRNGRFPKHQDCFVGPDVPLDPVPDSEGNFGFGAMAAYVASRPPGYMLDGAIAAAQWQTATVGFDGYRVDDVKGTNWNAVARVLNAPGLAHLYAFGEYFDGNSNALANWVDTLMHRRAAVLDFGFKFNVQNICNNASRSWMGALANIGFCTVDDAMAVTFCESADTDNSPGEQMIWNKILGYAIMLTSPGYPRVYYRDWAADEHCYALSGAINNLIWIHEHLANGPFVPRLDSDPQVFIHERTGLPGLPGCLCGFNNDRWRSHTRTVQTSFGPNQRLHEYTGKYGDIWTDAAGRATFTLPPNDNGASYLVFGRWIAPQGFSLRAMPTTQSFFGAADLDIAPASDTLLQVGRVTIAADTALTIRLAASRTGWTADTLIEARLIGPAGSIVAWCHLSHTDDGDGYGRAAEAGVHTLQVIGSQLPADTAFEFSITYTAPQDLA